MLSNEEFVQQSFNSNLYYLRSIREFLANLQLSFYENNKEYIERTENLAKKCEELGRKVVDKASGNVSVDALKYQIFVTDYTLPLEQLTEKLFGIKIATDITRKELNLKPGLTKNPDSELLYFVEQTNKEALEITKEFISMCSEIAKKLTNNELFSYSYPSLIRSMQYETEIYQNDLERLIDKNVIDPIYAINNEFWYSTEMLYTVSYLRGMIDPIHIEQIHKLDDLSNQFSSIVLGYKKVSLTPEKQSELTSKSIKAVEELGSFLEILIEELLNKKTYFIVEPIFLDNLYMGVNYFRYILNRNETKEKSFRER